MSKDRPIALLILIALVIGPVLLVQRVAKDPRETDAAGRGGVVGAPSLDFVKLAEKAKGTRDPRALSKAVEITFNDLKFRDAHDGTFSRLLLPQSVRDLDLVRVQIKGSMAPTFKRTGLNTFLLVPFEWPHSGRPPLYAAMVVELVEGTTCEFHSQEVEIEGRLLIDELKNEKSDGEVVCVYRLADAMLVERSARNDPPRPSVAKEHRE